MRITHINTRDLGPQNSEGSLQCTPESGSSEVKTVREPKSECFLTYLSVNHAWLPPGETAKLGEQMGLERRCQRVQGQRVVLQLWPEPPGWALASPWPSGCPGAENKTGQEDHIKQAPLLRPLSRGA